MKRKFLAVILSISLLTGCGAADINLPGPDTAAQAGTEAVSADLTSVSQDGDISQETTQADDPELYNDSESLFARGENNDPEAAALVDKAFSQDEYHLAVYMDYKALGGDDKEAQAAELTMFRNGLGKCGRYDMGRAGEDSFLVQMAEEDGYRYEYQNSGPYDGTVAGASYYDDAGTHMKYMEGGLPMGVTDIKDEDRTYFGEACDITCFDIFDALGSSKFSDLKKDGDTVTGRTSMMFFYVDKYGFGASLLGGTNLRADTEVNCTMEFDGDRIKSFDARPDKDDENNDFHYCIEFFDGPVRPVEFRSWIQYLSISDEFNQTSGTSTFDFSTIRDEDYIRWAEYGGTITDPGNGVVLRFVDKGIIGENGLVMKNVFVNEQVRYSDFRYFGDYSETAQRFLEYKDSIT